MRKIKAIQWEQDCTTERYEFHIFYDDLTMDTVDSNFFTATVNKIIEDNDYYKRAIKEMLDLLEKK